ncbi:MAG: ATP-binding cassette domain-containing protein [Polyangiales bacterium]
MSAAAPAGGADPAALEVQLQAHLSSRGRNFVLDVAFTAPPGITVLFGPSGAGKSSTLAALAGLRRPDRGHIRLAGEVWFDSRTGVWRPAHQRAQALVFQSSALFPHLSAQDNVLYGMDRRTPLASRRAQALTLLEQMQVAHLAARRPYTFSGGEAQRVALARAFARRPRLLLLDEAFSALDRQLQQSLCTAVRHYVAGAGIVALLVTHQVPLAQALGEHVVILADGQVAQTGPISTLR